MCIHQPLCRESDLAQFIESQCELKNIKQNFNLVYEGQSLNIALYLVEGSAQIIKGKSMGLLFGPVLIGLSELFQNEVLDSGIKVLKNSKICVIDRVKLVKYLKINKDLQKILSNSKR